MALPLTISLLFSLQVFACFFMTGLIWVVQLTHYPAFAFIPDPGFPAFHAMHSRGISYLAGPGMVLELLTGAALFWLARNWWFGLNFAGVIALWLSTFLTFVPLHGKLGERADEVLKARLVTYNWPRTALWSLRSAALLYLLTLVLSGRVP
jgi:hypothetical protein